MFAGFFCRRAKIAFDSVLKGTQSKKVEQCRMDIGFFACLRANTMKYAG